MPVRVLIVDDYSDALQLIRKLRRRDVDVVKVVFIVRVEDHRKIQKLPGRTENMSVIFFG